MTINNDLMYGDPFLFIHCPDCNAIIEWLYASRNDWYGYMDVFFCNICKSSWVIQNGSYTDKPSPGCYF